MLTHASLALRRFRRALSALVLLVLATALLAPPQANAAASFTVNWGKQENITKNNGVASKFPSLAVDSNNKTHIIYSTESGGLWYTNNVAGPFATPRLIDSFSGSDALPFYAIGIGPNNTLHVAYTAVRSDDQVYYRHGSLSGAIPVWSDRQLISEGYKSANAHMTVDKNNNAHIVWIDNRCGQYHVFYRMIRANGSRSDLSSPNTECVYQNRPQVVTTNDGAVHVVFSRDSADIYYARLDGTGWHQQNITAEADLRASFSGNPTITTDGVALYVAWDEGRHNHDILFKRSTDGGKNWSNYIALAGNDAYASFPNASWSPLSKHVYIAWADETDAPPAQRDIWYREFEPATALTSDAKRLFNEAGESSFPVIAAGPGRVALSWMDKRDRNIWQVYHMSGPITGTNTPTGCDGTLVVNGGATSTNNSTITLGIKPQACNPLPDQMQVSLDTLITDATPKQAYQATFNLTIPESDLCTHTVHVRLFTSGAAGEPFNASIIVDTRVSASVRALNPYLRGNTPAPPDDNGPRDGHPRYTRTGEAFLIITNTGDCVGLKEFSLPGNPVQPISGTPATAYVNVLQGSTDQGDKLFQVTVKDNLNTSALFPEPTQSFSLIYDTTAPVLNTSTFSPTVTVSAMPTQTVQLAATPPLTTTVNSILVTLALSDTHVTDNLYGPREGLASDTAFWGVFVANSREPNPTPATLKWSAVPVARPGAHFTINWSLFSGLGYGPDKEKPGDYYVFVKFIDGAGNASSEQIQSTRVVLASGYSIPTQRGPLILR